MATLLLCYFKTRFVWFTVYIHERYVLMDYILYGRNRRYIINTRFITEYINTVLNGCHFIQYTRLWEIPVGNSLGEIPVENPLELILRNTLLLIGVFSILTLTQRIWLCKWQVSEDFPNVKCPYYRYLNLQYFVTSHTKQSVPCCLQTVRTGKTQRPLYHNVLMYILNTIKQYNFFSLQISLKSICFFIYFYISK